MNEARPIWIIERDVDSWPMANVEKTTKGRTKTTVHFIQDGLSKSIRRLEFDTI